MIKVNSNFGKLQGSYLFSETAKRINAHAQAHPEAERSSGWGSGM